MESRSTALDAPPPALDPNLPTLAAALGERLQHIRQAQRLTMADVAGRARACGVPWDGPAVSRVEAGKRQVSVVELFALARLYGRPVVELLPEQACRVTDEMDADEGALRGALTDYDPGLNVPALDKQAGAWAAGAVDNMAPVLARYPGTDALTVSEGARHARDEAVVKAAARLGVEPLDVAVLAERRWQRDLVTERDARVAAIEGEDVRARQARRGHVTRALLDELRPAVKGLQAMRQTPPGPGGDGQGVEHGDQGGAS